MKIKEARAPYTTDELAVINEALVILGRRLKRPTTQFYNPSDAASYLKLYATGLDTEQFNVLYLDVKNRLIAHETPFKGTLTATSVYPREVVKRALFHNAASVIISHNHPSGVPEPSDADRHLTTTLLHALALVDVRLLDHIVVAGDQHYIFSEHGEI